MGNGLRFEHKLLSCPPFRSINCIRNQIRQGLLQFSLHRGQGQVGLDPLFDIQRLILTLAFVDGQYILNNICDGQYNRLGIVAIEAQRLLRNMSDPPQFLICGVQIALNLLRGLRPRSDLPGVTTALMLEHMVEGYEASMKAEKVQTFSCSTRLVGQALPRNPVLDDRSVLQPLEDFSSRSITNSDEAVRKCFNIPVLTQAHHPIVAPYV
jgi:hypothetical protein